MDTGAPDPRPGEREEHPQILQNETPGVLTEGFITVTAFLQNYGWFLLIGVAVLIFLKTKLDPYLQSLKEKREQAQEKKNYDSSTALQRQEAMDAARRRLQEQHDAEAAKFQEEQKKKEEAKRAEKIQDWERHQRGEGYRNKYKPQEESPSSSNSSTKPKPKAVYRTADYNPLAGGGGGACYRPSRRGGAGGG